MFLFTNCEDDFTKEESNEHDSGIRTTQLTAKEIDAMPEVSSILNKIDEERTIAKTQKSVYNSDYDFYVNKDNVLKISKGSYHSLTFPVYRLPDNGLTENLVLSLEKGGKYSASLYTYDLTPEEKEKLRKNTPFLFENPVKRKQLPLFKSSTLTGKITQIWYTEIAIIPCSSGDHNSKNLGIWHKCEVIPPQIFVITRSLLLDDGDNGWVTGGDYAAPGSGGGFVGSGTYNPNVPPYDPNKSDAILTLPQLNIQTNEQKFYNQLDNAQKININVKEVRIPLLAQLQANNYYDASQEVAEFVLSNIAVGNLSTDLRIKLMQLAAVNISNASIICEYLQENDFSEESIEAVENALSDISNNIYPTTILNLVTKQWQKDVINNVLSLSTPFINTIQQTFNTNQNVNLSFINKNAPDSNANTSFPTSSQISSGNFTVYITYDNSYLDTATNLSIVAVTVHEMVHAHLRNLYITGQLPSVDASYNNLFNAYIQFYKIVIKLHLTNLTI
jgi:hypothetical protein